MFYLCEIFMPFFNVFNNVNDLGIIYETQNEGKGRAKEQNIIVYQSLKMCNKKHIIYMSYTRRLKTQSHDGSLLHNMYH